MKIIRETRDVNWLMFFLLLCTVQVFAFNEKNVLIHTFTIDSGLPQSTVEVITQDKQGFLWFGTQAGLVRFDGYQFRVFPINKQDKIQRSWITALYADDHGAVWAATERGELSVKLANQIGFARLAVSHKLGVITKITQDDQRDIWLGGQNGLMRMRWSVQQGSYNATELPKTLANLTNISMLYQDHLNQLWIGTAQDGLYRYQPKNEVLTSFSQLYHEHGQQPITQRIMAIKQDSAGNLLIGIKRLGLARFNPTSTRLEVVNFTTATANAAPLDITQIVTDQLGRTWLGISKYGVVQLVSDGDGTNGIERQDRKSTVVNEQMISTMFVDNAGTLWIAADTKLYHIDIRSNPFTTYTNHSSPEQGDRQTLIGAIAEGEAGSLWLGTMQHGLLKFEPVLNTSLVFTHQPSNNASINDDRAVSLLYDSDANLWVGTRKGLDLYVPAQQTFKHLFVDEPRYRGFSHSRISVLIQDEQQQRWVGTDNGWLIAFNEQGEVQSAKQILAADQYSIGETNLTAITPDNHGNLWLGIRGVTLARYHIASEQVTFFYDKSADNGQIQVYDIHLDQQQNIWLAGRQNGLGLFNLASSSVTWLNTRDGLSHNTVYAILEDERGSLWLSTLNGLNRFEPSSKQFTRYYRNDGISADEFNAGAFHRGASGRFYFGSIDGVTSFIPTELYQASKTPPLVFNGVTIFNATGEHELSLANLVDQSLSHHTQMLVFSFALLDFINPEKVNYQYRLNQQQWIELGNRHEVVLTGLSAGNYRFEVRAQTSHGQFVPSTIKTDFTLLAAPWFSWWAWLSYAVIVLAIIGAFIYQHLIRIKQQAVNEERLKLSLWGSGDEMWDWDITAKTVYREHKLQHIDFPRERIISDLHQISAYIHPNDFELFQHALTEHLAGNTAFYEARFRVKGINQAWEWILDRGKVVSRDANHHALRISGTTKCISAVKKIEDSLQLVANSFENTSDGIWISDQHFVIQTVNPAYSQITGKEKSALIGKNMHFPRVGKQTDEFERQVINTLMQQGHWHGEVSGIRYQQDIFPIELRIDAVKDKQGEVTHYIGIFSDITRRKNAEYQLRRLANYDPITHLPNRTLFTDRLDHALQGAKYAQRQIAMLFIDLDNFKNLNDSLGHPMGDKALYEVALRLKECIMPDDTAARFGGDEFAVLLEDTKSVASVASVAGHIISSLEFPLDLRKHQVVVGCSIGIVLFPEHGTTSVDLIRNADSAMYQAKLKGRNNIQFFTEALTQQALHRLEIEQQLREAINNDELVPFFQPKVNTATGAINNLEVLVRWYRNGQQVMGPGEFIPIAEQSGLIRLIGEIVLAKSCKIAADWLRLGLDFGRIAVNLSAQQFMQKHLIKLLQEVLADTGLPANKLELEVTEGMVMTDVETAISTMRQIRNMGIHLSIDDFGTGYSSLSYLKRFPLNALKIDIAFVRDMTKSAREYGLVVAIINLAHNLGLVVIAEGVETIQQLEQLKQLNCEYIQGYLFSQALKAEDFQTLLERDANLYQQLSA